MGVVTGDRNESETSRWGVEDLSAGKYEFAILTMSYKSEVLSGSTVYSGQLNGLRCEETGSLPYIGPRKGDPGPKNPAMTSTFKPSWTVDEDDQKQPPAPQWYLHVYMRKSFPQMHQGATFGSYILLDSWHDIRRRSLPRVSTFLPHNPES